MQQNIKKPGNLFIVSAPSGCGKTSLINALVQQTNNLKISVSYTTRAQRPGEIDGEHYHFVTPEVFNQLAAQQEFLEQATVFDHQYATSKTWVEEQLNQGLNIILEIDWQGARQIKQSLNDHCISVFILPPSLTALQSRLQTRQQDSAAVIQRRMADAQAEMSHYGEYDYLLINQDFNQALSELDSVVQAASDSSIAAHELTLQVQQNKHAELLANLV